MVGCSTQDATLLSGCVSRLWLPEFALLEPSTPQRVSSLSSLMVTASSVQFVNSDNLSLMYFISMLLRSYKF